MTVEEVEDLLHWFWAVQALERRLGTPVVSQRTIMEVMLGMSAEEYDREMACIATKYLLD